MGETEPSKASGLLGRNHCLPCAPEKGRVSTHSWEGHTCRQGEAALPELTGSEPSSQAPSVHNCEEVNFGTLGRLV